jgi:hypothetical protein
MEYSTMTRINYAEYNALKSFDQALVWAVIRLRAANQHPDNKDLLDYVTIRPEARDFIRWSTQLDEQGEPYFTASLLFPLTESHTLETVAIPARIPNYTDFQPPASPMDVPATGRGLPLPEIPSAIDTLERLACWLCLIGNQHGDLMRYINATNTRSFATGQSVMVKPTISITAAGLSYTKILSEAELYARRSGASGNDSGSSTASDAFAAFDSTPQNPNNNDLAEKLEEAREQSRAATEPPQIDPGRGYERIDTLPICKDQDPSIKAFNTPLAKLLK